MIANCTLQDDRWSGTWRTGKHVVRVGDYVVVPCGGTDRLATVTAVGRTRKKVGCRFKGRLKTIRRIANTAEVRQSLLIELARENYADAHVRLVHEKNVLRQLLRAKKRW